MKKLHKRILSLFLVFCMVCSAAPNMPVFAAKTVKAALTGIESVIIPEKNLNVTAGEGATITGYASFSNASASNAWASASDAERKAAFQATSSNAKLVTVDMDTLILDDQGNFELDINALAVTTASNAIATVTVTMGNQSEQVTVTVKPDEAEEPAKPVTSITVTSKTGTYTLYVDEKLQMQAEVKPQDADNKNVKWLVSDPTVATISADGLITPVKPGTVKVWAEALDDSLVSSSKVEVKILERQPGTVYPDSLFFRDRNLQIGKGAQENLGDLLIVQPNNATYQIQWSCSDTEVAQVSQEGVLTAKNFGTANIKASVKGKDGKDLTASLSVLVRKPRLFFTSTQLFMLNGTSKNVSVRNQYWPVGEECSISYAVSNDSILSIEDKGNGKLSITAKANGTATITAKAGNVSTVCQVLVTSDEKNPGIVLDKALNEFWDIFENQDENVTLDEKISVAKKVANAVKDLINDQISDIKDFAKVNDYILDTIYEIESYLATIYDWDIVVDPELEVGVDFVGAALNMATIPGAYEAKLMVAPQTMPSDVPGDKTSAVSLDIKLQMLDEQGKQLPVGKLLVPIIIYLEVPESLVDETSIVIYHYTSKGRQTIKPVVENGMMTFAVTEFSTFVVAKYTSPSKPSGGSGGSGGSGSVSDGSISGQWILDATGGWWFKKTTGGFPANQWAKINGKQYRFNAEGYMQTGWYFENNAWYYLQPQGDMAVKTWVSVNEKWYYIHDNGVMLANQWLQYNGAWYYLTADGSMAVSTTTPDGYTVNETGVWIP